MPFLGKLLLTNLVIVTCVQVGRRFPPLAGLVATMPITTPAVLLWLHSDNPGNSRLLADYAKGALWGIIPTFLFFAVAWLCLRRGIALPLTLTAAFGVWLGGAALHQWLVR